MPSLLHLPTRGEVRLALALATLASVAVVVTLWVVPYLPTHDGPHHVFLAWLKNHYDDPGVVHSRAHDLLPGAPLTNLGFSALFRAFESVLPWRDALRATLSVIALTWGWGVFAMVAAFDRRRMPLGILGFACALQWALYMGFFSYLLSIALGFLAVALALHTAPWRLLHRFVLSALLFILAVFHVFAAEVVVSVFLGLVLFYSPPGRRVRELTWLAAMALPALVVVFLSTIAAAEILRHPEVRQGTAQWLPWPRRIEMLARCSVGGPGWRAWPPVVLTALGLWAAGRRLVRREATGKETTFAIASASMLLLALVMPFHARAWDFFSPRFAPVGLMLALPLVPFEQLERTKRSIALVAIALFTIGSIAWAGRYHLRLARRTADAWAGLEAPIHRDGYRLPIVFDPAAGGATDAWQREMPEASPLLNIGSLYALAQGGMVPYAFTSIPSLHEFLFRPEALAQFPPVPDRRYASSFRTAPPPARRLISTMMAAYGARYQDVIIVGEPSQHHDFLARGYVSDWRHGEVLIARFVGCPVRLSIQRSSLDSSVVQVEYGWYPFRERFWAGQLGPNDNSLQLPLSPCGDIWLRVRVMEASRDLRPRRCIGSDPDGLQIIRIQRGQHEITCRLAAH